VFSGGPTGSGDSSPSRLGPVINPGRPRPGTGPGGPMIPGPGAAGSEDFGDGDVQMTSGLIEVSIYGIVSLYEKYDPTQATPTTNP
jgi:hypothetical protein